MFVVRQNRMTTCSWVCARSAADNGKIMCQGLVRGTPPGVCVVFEMVAFISIGAQPLSSEFLEIGWSAFSMFLE